MKRSYLVILILIQPFSTFLFVNYSLNILASDQDRTTLIENPFNYPLNTLLSVDDSRWPHHVEPTMAIGDNGVLFVGWKNALEHDGGGQSVGFTYSNDSTWQYPYDMSPAWSTGSIQSDPWMVYFNHTLYYSYLEFPTGAQGQGQISFAQTSNLGRDWTQVRASYGTGYYADKETFAISRGGIIYLVYSDVHTVANTTIAWVKLSRSFDGGKTFIDNITISDTEGIDLGANVLPDESGNVFTIWTHYTWEDENMAPTPELSTLLFDNSTDYGNTFGKDRDFIPEYNATWSMRNPENGRSAKHTLAIIEKEPISGRMYVTWADVATNVSDPTNSWDVYFRYSDDDGTTWSNITRVNNNVNANQWNPDMEFDSQGNVHFVYYDESSPEGRHVKHRIFYPNTSEFSTESQVTTEPSSPEFTRPGEYMSIRIDSEDCPHVVWTDARNNELDIFYARACTQLPTQSSSQSTQSVTQTSFESIPFILGTLVIFVIVISIKRKQSV